MKTLFALYEHTRIGFPLVKLKWTVENGEITSAYVTEKGVMSGEWVWHNQYPIPFMRDELERFDEWAVGQFQHDAFVQG